MLLIILSFIFACFFAMNIGASGSAASMGVAYGSGAVKKSNALLLCALGIILGSIIGGQEVVKTMGHGLVPSEIMSIEIVLIVLTAAAMTLFIANIIGIPLSTSEVTVGSIIGVGLAFQKVYFHKLIIIFACWIIVPFLAFYLTLIIGHILKKRANYVRKFETKHYRIVLKILLLVGFIEAFSAGMNNVANAVGPLVGAGLISIFSATLLGGFMVAMGAVILGGKVIETNGKKITVLSPIRGIAVSSVSSLIVIVASIFGIPVPITQATTAGILGIGFSNEGWALWQKNVIKRILKVWLVSPVFSLVLSYGLVTLLYQLDLYRFVLIVSACLATAGTISLYQNVRNERVTQSPNKFTEKVKKETLSRSNWH